MHAHARACAHARERQPCGVPPDGSHACSPHPPPPFLPLPWQAGGPRALEEELRLQRLVFEVGRLPVDAAASEAAPPGGAGAAPRASAGRAFMRVRDAGTSEVCLEWAEPASTRSTDPSKAKPQGKLSRRLYEGEGGEGGEETGGVRRR